MSTFASCHSEAGGGTKLAGGGRLAILNAGKTLLTYFVQSNEPSFGVKPAAETF